MTANGRSSVPRLLALLMVLVFSGTLAGSAAHAQGAAEATPAPAAAMTADEAIAAVTTEDGTLRFDVAEDATRFVFAP